MLWFCCCLKKVTCENGCERSYILQSPKKTDSVSDDIIRQIFNESIVNPTDNTLKDHRNDRPNVDTHQSNNDDDNKIGKLSVKSHFVEIGEFSCGSIFGLGEKMDDRVIVAKHTTVQCLLIPHYWLFQKKLNAGNIWQR